ncbi:hypothetical protein M3650_08855 [Paenibacillus sp. MER TA 81-3]|uniref:hypothetical protein n=1 Tax=Paenibacillus sp. MER TA 81-3 TaxID=2939573 RepID=UPI0020421988|nr:hypothetical protein [Paenibacillus sp. MER TA 81-3]MCM3338747.1 hypothetical protein [Paenibacillus sp. MER TA 81-3]
MRIIQEYVSRNYDRVIGWGTSGYYEKYSKELSVELDYLIDNDPNKRNQLLDGKKIYPPSILCNETPKKTLVIIFSSFYNEIKETIHQFGDFYTISGNQLIGFGHLLMKSENKLLEDDELDKGIIISISRNNFALYLGGTSKFIREQMILYKEKGCINLHLFWRIYNIKGFNGSFLTVVKNGSEIGLFTIDQFFEAINNIKALIVHNLIGMELSVLDTIINKLDSKVPILYYLHDFSCICSNIKLMHNDETFCHGYEDEWKLCASCESNEQKKKIFEYHSTLFSINNIKLIAPSNHTKYAVTKAFNLDEKKIAVINHQKHTIVNKEKISVNNKIKIAYVGYKHIHKGWEIFKKIFFEFKNKYEFYCLGTNDEFIEGINYIDVSFIENGELAMVNKLVEHSIDVAFLWSVWPETYSYTYYESFAAGSLVITNVLSGNIADQVKVNQNGVVFNNYTELRDLLSNEEELRNTILNNKKIIKNLRSNKEDIFEEIDIVKNINNLEL